MSATSQGQVRSLSPVRRLCVVLVRRPSKAVAVPRSKLPVFSWGSAKPCRHYRLQRPTAAILPEFRKARAFTSRAGQLYSVAR
jgi:hypothetical protein